MTTEVDGISARVGRAVRAHRTARGLSVSELAREAGLSKTIVSRIEAGDGNPSIETLWRLHRALGVPLGALVGDDQAPRRRVIPHRSGEAMHADSGMDGWLLHADGRDHRSEVYELELPAGVEQRSGAHMPGTEELVVCVSGRVLAGPEGEEAELRPGDALWFVADGPHRYRGVRDARLLCLMRYAPAGRP